MYKKKGFLESLNLYYAKKINYFNDINRNSDKLYFW